MYEVTGSVLEIGAIPSKYSLLNMESLSDVKEKVGINLDEPSKYSDFVIMQGNSNCMDFENERFDAILCNAVLEHDRYFWKSLDEIKRVTKRGGVIIIGVPGYKRTKIQAVQKLLNNIPLIKRLELNPNLNSLFTATPTYKIHESPGDYYRFSEQAVCEVFFSGMKNINICSLMTPARIVCAGIKP